MTPPFFDSFGDVSFRVLCLLRSGSFVSIYRDVSCRIDESSPLLILFLSLLLCLHLFEESLDHCPGFPTMNSPTEHSIWRDIPEAFSNNSLLPKLSPHGASPSAVATR